MEDLTYPIEVLKKEIDDLNKSKSLNAGGQDGIYHLHKMQQVFKAIEMLQTAHNKGRE
jgi:hypothetical protein